MREEFTELFKADLDPKRIIRDLSILVNLPIEPGKTLLFFDEVQQVPSAITALRYFYENIPELHVIAAGSLIDFAIEKVGIPVGRVSTMYLFPMTYVEFLGAIGESKLVEVLLDLPVSEPIHNKLIRYLGEYCAIGGMPEAVKLWVEEQNHEACFHVHQTLVDNYQQDFQKYAKKSQIKYVETLFRQIPSSIGKRFKYSAIHGEYRKRELAPALELLATAGIVHMVHHTSGQGLPFGAQINREKFKILFLDIALSQAILGIHPKDYLVYPKKALVNYGSMTKAFVGQELVPYHDPSHKLDLYYWLREVRNSSAEVDYLIKLGDDIVPVEVKTGSAAHLKSLQYFFNQHENSSYGICFSVSNYQKRERMIACPLYALGTLYGAERIRAFLNG